MVKINPENYKIYKLFLYAIEHLQTKDKVRFYYDLKGRDGKSGLITHYKINQLARGALLVPHEHKDAVSEFLNKWKCRYETKEVLMHNG